MGYWLIFLLGFWFAYTLMRITLRSLYWSTVVAIIVMAALTAATFIVLIANGAMVAFR